MSIEVCKHGSPIIDNCPECMGELMAEVALLKSELSACKNENGAELASWYQTAIDKVLARLSESAAEPPTSRVVDAPSKFEKLVIFVTALRMADPVQKCPSCIEIKKMADEVMASIADEPGSGREEKP